MAVKIDPNIKEAVKTEYITTSIDQRSLAQKYNVSITTISGWAKNEGWLELRDNYRNELEMKALQMAQQKRLENLSDRNQVHLEMYNDLLEQAKLEMMKPTPDWKRIQALEKISTIFSRVQQGERLALGLDNMKDSDKGALSELLEALKSPGDE